VLPKYPEVPYFGYWTNPDNRKKYLLFLKDQLGGTYESLYKASYEHFIQTRGRSLLKFYGKQSPSFVIMTEFAKEYDWLPFRFIKTPSGFWNDLGRKFSSNDPTARATVTKYIDYLKSKYSEKLQASDWDNVAEGTLPSPLSTKEKYQLQFLGGLANVLRRLSQPVSASEHGTLLLL